MRAFALIFCGVAVASCSRATGTSPLPGAEADATLPLSASFARGSTQADYKSLYSFQGDPDGQQPNGSLIDVNGALFGTTLEGGELCPQSASQGISCGTVFRVRPPGKENVLYRFKGGTMDGALPQGSLVTLNGELYGVTVFGGDGGSGSGCNDLGCGTVFNVSVSGKERILYSFKGGATDGWYPEGGLAAMNGSLYGTTSNGGGSRCSGNVGCGTVFEVSLSGVEKVLYHFKGGADGEAPNALTTQNGALYGTTSSGGGSGCGGDGCGTVFEVSTSGAERVLHRFRGGRDGQYPVASMIVLKRTLYGTTVEGGGNGCGTVFEVRKSGVVQILYRFKCSPDGAYAFGLTATNRVLYGATTLGGNYCSGSGIGGCGTVFDLSTSGKESVLYSFRGVPDGDAPVSLLAIKGTLYGVAAFGGSGKCINGCGTIFEVTP